MQDSDERDWIMIGFLAKLFIRNYKDTDNLKVREKYGILCGGVGIGFNVLLFALKALTGFFTGSIAVVADAFNNLSDAGSSIISMIGFKLGGQSPDPDHPFGHGRMEYLSGLGVSILIIVMSVELIKGAVEKIIHPALPISDGITIGVLVFSILVKLYMGYYNRAYGQKLASSAMTATARDSFSDSISTIVVLMSVIAGMLWGIPIDGYCGLIVGLLVLWTGIRSARDTIDPLLGQPPSKEFVKELVSIVKEHDIVMDIHDLVVHDYGPGRCMISLHAEVPYNIDILKIHDEIDNIEYELKKRLKCEAVIHMDPIVIDDEEMMTMKEAVGEMLREIDPVLKFHDFRMVKGHTHTNLIFDVLAPFGYKMEDDELKTVIANKLSEKKEKYIAVIQVDHSYVK